MDDVDRRNAGLEEVNRMLPEPLDLHPKAFAIAHDEAEVADLRNVYARIVDLVEDAAANGEPEPRSSRGAADHLLIAGAPARLQAGAARRRAPARGIQDSRDARRAPARAAPSIAASGFTMRR